METYINSDGQELVKTTWSDGTEVWYKDGLRHRLDGPAVICSNGYQAWYKDDKLHRLDGPAWIGPDGKEEYWLDGEKTTKKEVDLLWLKKQVGK